MGFGASEVGKDRAERSGYDRTGRDELEEQGQWHGIGLSAPSWLVAVSCSIVAERRRA